MHTFCCRSSPALLLGGLPFSLTSFNDDIDPIPGVRDSREATVLECGLDTPVDGLEMEGVLLTASVIEARGLVGGLTVSGSGEETIEALDGGLLIAEAGDFKTDDERVGLVPNDDDSDFLSAADWTLGGRTEVLRVWVGAGGLGGGIAVLAVAILCLFTGEAVGDGLTPGVLTLERAGLPTPTI